MKLAVVLTQPFWFDGTTFTTRYPFASFMIELAIHVEKLILFVPLKQTSDETGDYIVCLPKNVEVVTYPFCRSLRDQYKHIFKIAPAFILAFIRNIGSFDTCLFVSSSIVPAIAFAISLFSAKWTVFYLRNNIRECYSIQDQTGPGKLFGIILGSFESMLANIMLRKCSISFVIGKQLYDKYKSKYKSIHLFYANLLSVNHMNQLACLKKLKNNTVNIVAVGRIVPQKGFNYLVSAISDLVNNEKHNIICTIVGSGDEKKRLLALIKSKKVERNFQFIGNIPWGKQLFDIYRKNDIFVLSSLTEGFPKTIFEAMAFGCAVVATDVGGVSGIVKHRYNGIVVSPHSSSEISDAINELCYNPILMQSIIKNGYLTANQFTIENQQRELISKIENCIEQT